MKTAPCVMLLAASLSAGSLASAGPSFPCDKAQSRVEKTICADAELSDLDEYLGRYYAGARQALADAGECFVTNQRQWLRTVRDACADPACLKAAYLARLSELDGLQPGATAIKAFPLPHGPTLAWIIPAALDQVSAPPKPNARPLVAQGTLLDEVATGDGFVLRTREGQSYLLVLLMFLGGESVTRLTSLAKDPRATYLARGYAATNNQGHTYFEPSRCVFIYQLP
jgi:uncharacterized protein